MESYHIVVGFLHAAFDSNVNSGLMAAATDATHVHRISLLPIIGPLAFIVIPSLTPTAFLIGT